MSEVRDKAAWRGEILARRKAITPGQREREAEALARHAAALVETVTWICAYVPVGGEPGSLAMLDALRAAGARVLLPVTGEPGPLEWAEYEGPERLRRGRFGLREPEGAPIADALRLAEMILIPALAVDRSGTRLGRGAGYYDRSLNASRADARLIAVVRDDEVVAHLPRESHDHRMGWALTPFGGLRELDE
ncbi:5-formyltetrahydrofolate cyclo-ligase [Nocardia sp. NPDC056000]|uniref:5-formyltetrahydrofolate cyclo-ligase n=1 Tax=Nocardia sp. NPDC056000 TaxID=3345674 RepID=UPI0035DBC09E